MLGTLIKFTGGVLAGTALGMALGRLLAPTSGQELKSNMQAYWDGVVEVGRQAEAQRRAELEAQFAQAKKFNG